MVKVCKPITRPTKKEAYAAVLEMLRPIERKLKEIFLTPHAGPHNYTINVILIYR